MVSLTAGVLTVRYSKFRDRLSHTIGIIHGETLFPLLESIEGTEQEPWPASPPMQQMVEESFSPGASPVLLGVGLSGNGHWSTAIETQRDQLLKFDIACKNSKSSSWFGSEYRVLAAAQSGADGSVWMSLDPIQCETRIEISVPIGQLQFFVLEQKIRFSPLSDPSDILTHRWCYEIRLLTGH